MAIMGGGSGGGGGGGGGVSSIQNSVLLKKSVHCLQNGSQWVWLFSHFFFVLGAPLVCVD